MSDIPSSVRADVIKRLYADADRLDWELLPLGQKTKQYALWIEDPAIGGLLTRYLPEGEARVWVKDVPMKEFARAREGIGSYTDYIPRRYLGPTELVNRAFGENWRIVDDSIGEKPLHCLATNGSTVRYLCWGKPNTFRDLVWAATKQAVKNEGTPMIVVALLEGTILNASDRAEHTAIATHCRLDIRHLERRLGRLDPS